ncbi:MAG: hypothetical protein AAF492_31830, partial [Verrucomicrobiota bacterium]
HRFEHSSSMSQVTMSEGDTTVTLTTRDGDRQLVAKRRNGDVLFDGPVNTEEERGKLPEEVAALYNELDNSVSVQVFGGGRPFMRFDKVVTNRHNNSFSDSDNGSSRVRVVTRNGITATVTEGDEGATHLRATRGAEVLYDGPFDSDDDKADVPDEVKNILDQTQTEEPQRIFRKQRPARNTLVL